MTSWSSGDMDGLIAMHEEDVFVRPGWDKEYVGEGGCSDVYLGKAGVGAFLRDCARFQWRHGTMTDVFGDANTSTDRFRTWFTHKRTGRTSKRGEFFQVVKVSDAGLINRLEFAQRDTVSGLSKPLYGAIVELPLRPGTTVEAFAAWFEENVKNVMSSARVSEECFVFAEDMSSLTLYVSFESEKEMLEGMTLRHQIVGQVVGLFGAGPPAIKYGFDVAVHSFVSGFFSNTFTSCRTVHVHSAKLAAFFDAYDLNFEKMFGVNGLIAVFRWEKSTTEHTFVATYASEEARTAGTKAFDDFLAGVDASCFVTAPEAPTTTSKCIVRSGTDGLMVKGTFEFANEEDAAEYDAVMAKVGKTGHFGAFWRPTPTSRAWLGNMTAADYMTWSNSLTPHMGSVAPVFAKATSVNFWFGGMLSPEMEAFLHGFASQFPNLTWEVSNPLNLTGHALLLSTCASSTKDGAVVLYTRMRIQPGKYDDWAATMGEVVRATVAGGSFKEVSVFGRRSGENEVEAYRICQPDRLQQVLEQQAATGLLAKANSLLDEKAPIDVEIILPPGADTSPYEPMVKKWEAVPGAKASIIVGLAHSEFVF